MFLSYEEIVELTGKKQRAAQVRALRYMGIEHRCRPNGSVAVLKTHVDKTLDGNQIATKLNEHQPIWGDVT